MKKLYRYGLRGKIHDLIRSFLSNRKQFIVIKSAKSDTLLNDLGTPQGSTLGPLLFLIFINDLFKLKLNGKLITFADDAAIVYCAVSAEHLNRMMLEDLKTLADWFMANKLTLNLKKTKSMIFHPRQETKKYSLNIDLNGTPIDLNK